MIALAAGAGIERLELIDGSTQGDISLSHNKQSATSLSHSQSFQFRIRIPREARFNQGERFTANI